MSIPDWPYLPHLRWLPRQSGSFSRNWLWILPKLGGQRLAVEPVQERLGVEQVHLAGAAGHEQEDAPLGLRGEMARPRGAADSSARPGPRLAASRSARPSRPKPQPAALRNSRRLEDGMAAGRGTAGELGIGFLASSIGRVLRAVSRDVKEFVAVEHAPAPGRPRPRLRRLGSSMPTSGGLRLSGTNAARAVDARPGAGLAGQRDSGRSMPIRGDVVLRLPSSDSRRAEPALARAAAKSPLSRVRAWRAWVLDSRRGQAVWVSGASKASNSG